MNSWKAPFIKLNMLPIPSPVTKVIQVTIILPVT